MKTLVPVNNLTSTSNITTPSLKAGDTYFNTADNTFRVYNGTSWITYSASTTVNDPITITLMLGGM